MFPGETILNGKDGRPPPTDDPHVSPFQVLGHESYWYIGTIWSYDGCEKCVKEYGPPERYNGFQEPCTRETDYFGTKTEAEDALKVYHQSWRLLRMRTP